MVLLLEPLSQELRHHSRNDKLRRRRLKDLNWLALREVGNRENVNSSLLSFGMCRSQHINAALEKFDLKIFF